MSKKNSRIQSLIQIALFAGILIFINIVANARVKGKSLYSFIDLTEEKRFSLTDGTLNLLHELDDQVYVNVLLEGDFPAGFKRLQNAIRDILEDFRTESGYIEYGFENPTAGKPADARKRQEILAEEGIFPINLRLKDASSTSKQLIYPHAIIRYKGRSWSVNLLENEVPGMSNEVILNNSIGLLEYKIANTIQKLQNSKAPAIAFTEGHGELRAIETADLEKTLREYYQTGRINLDSIVSIEQEANVLIIAKPQRPFSDKDKFKIDQYIMNGGKVLWLLDQVAVTLDSLQGRKAYFPSPYDLNLDDLLFRYGIRLQSNLLLDLQCTNIPLATGYVGNAPQLELYRYPYHIVATPRSSHPAVKSLGPINLYYANSIDGTIETKTNIQKTVLLTTSNNTRYQRLPVEMNFEFLRYEPDVTKFDKGPQTVALLLEGNFSSLYENRVAPEMLNALTSIGISFKKQSEPNKMIVVSDGDVAKNTVKGGGQSYNPLGWNEFDKYKFANKDFIINMIEYMIDDRGLIAARGKDIKLRMMDTTRAKEESNKWQLINLVLPLAFLGLFGFGFNWVRRRRFG